MTVKNLAAQWDSSAQTQFTKSTYQVHLSIEDAAKIDALTEMYPRRQKEQLLSELVSAALNELESSFPYKQGREVIAEDEEGYPMYADAGSTPIFLELTKKYLAQYKSDK